MTPLDRLAQTARIRGHLIDWSTDPIRIYIPTDFAAMSYAGSCHDLEANGWAWCGELRVRFIAERVRVPRQRVGSL